MRVRLEMWEEGGLGCPWVLSAQSPECHPTFSLGHTQECSGLSLVLGHTQPVFRALHSQITSGGT